MIYTSGSTGQPKGVMISHGNLQQLLHGLQQTVYSQLGEQPLRVGWNASLSFDASVKQWVQLLSGHAIYLLGEEERLEAERVLDYVKQHDVQVLDTTPGQLRTWLDAGIRDGAAGEQLSVLLVGGEAIDEQLWQELAALNQPVSYNVYGPTECTVDATWSVVSGARAVLGQRLPHVSVYVLDEQMRLAPVGVRGELCIGGGGVGRGYLRRAELTAERYVPHPFSTVPGERLYRTGDEGRRLADGRIEYLGRRDQQVKVRGYRIELGEIEAVLESHAAVRQAVVTVREEQLVAYLVGRRGVQLHESGVREFGEGYEVSAGLRVAQQNKNETDYLYHEIFERRCYLQHGVSIERGDWVVDVGANIGLFSLQAAQMGAARVYAFEPLGPVCASLRQNARLGGGRIRVFEHGLSQTEGEAQFTYYPRYTMMSGQSEYADAVGEVEVIKRYLENEVRGGSVDAASLLKDADELLAGRFTGQVQQCRLRRLTDVLREEQVKRVDLLKIDVQRAEWDVLQGLEAEDWERIGQVVLEVHDWEGGSGRVAEIRELLQQKGYEVTVAQDELLVGTDRYNVYGVRRGYRENGRSHVVEEDEWSSGGEWEVREVREYARERLPEYMVPHRWVVLEQMPLTAHGKVDRVRLPAPVAERAAEREAEGEWTAVEELVAGIWNEVLKQQIVARSESFFELGGHSLLATQVISRVREVFGVEIGLRRLFEEPTLGGFSRSIEEELRAGAGVTVPALERLEAEEREQWSGMLPLSFAQQRLWFLDQLERGNPFYNTFKAVRLKGELNVEALELTLSEIVRRHEVLRTRFVNAGGEPRQEVLPHVPIKLSVTEVYQEAWVRELVTAESSEPFDLATGPMLRVKLLRLSAEDHVVLLTMHHIVSDGWSMGVLIKEVATLYATYSQGADSPLTELPIQYSDYAIWQRGWLQGEELERQLTYWREQLGGELPVLELPTDHARPAVPSYRGAHLGFRLSPEVSEALKELSQREGVTLFMTLLAAFQTLLHRYSGQREIVVGTDVANRNYAETETLIGFFVNQLVLRVDMGGEPTFVELLRRVKEVCLGAYAHQDVPFEKLVEELQPERDLSRSPLFQVKLVLQNTPRESLKLGGLQLGTVGVDTVTARFDLTVLLDDIGDELVGVVVYSAELFERARMERLLRHFEVLLQGIVTNAEQRLWELPLLDEAEWEQIVRGWNETRGDDGAMVPVPELFAAQAARQPQAVALVCGAERLSYGELNERANQLAHYLRKQGVGPEVVVGMCVERSVEMVVALLGIMKAGGAYLPLDPEYPSQRLQYMLADAQVGLVLTTERLLEQLPVHWGCTIVLEEEAEAIARESSENPAAMIEAENLAYVIYTSGTTGQPKGVMVTHGGLRNLAAAQVESFGIAGSARVLQFASLNFDASIFELCLALCQGAALHLASREQVLVGSTLRELLVRQEISVVTLPPSVLKQLGAGEELGQLETLIVAGEACGEELVAQWSAGRRFFNAYGPTETTVWATVAECHRGEGRPAIGRPIRNTGVYVLDERQQVVAVGVRGEIYIGGAGVARGYLERAALTAERFVPHPYSVRGGERLYRSGDEGRYLADGRIEYLGRRDQQVKVRGYRIELGDIEAVLESHARVQQAVVTVSAQQQLVGYVVGLEGNERAVATELKGYLRERLPEYMVPQRWVVLEQVPLNANGKVDRKRLPEPLATRALEQEAAAEWTPVEELVAGIWSEVLQRDVAGRDENFFELGGHSLLATQAVSRVRQVFGVEVALRRLFEQSTLRGFSQCIEAALRAGAGSMIPTLQRLGAAERESWGGLLPLSFAQQRLWFLDQLEPGSATYSIPLAVRLKGQLHVAALEQTLSEIVRRHEVFRTRFITVDGEPRQEVLAAQYVTLPVTDLGELDEVEREAAVRETVTLESGEPFDLASGPLLRAKLLRLSAEEHVVLLTIHHIVGDGWSMGVLIKEVAALYAAYSQGDESPLPELGVQYGDFAVWQRGWLQGEELEQQLAYWRRQLGGELPTLELPTDRPRPAMQSYRGANLGFRLSPEVSAGLKELSRREGATLFMTLLAAFQTLLHRYSGQDDIVVGSPVAGRNYAETEGLIGFLVNTLSLRTDMSGEPTFVELLKRVKEVCLGAYAHQDVPFEKLVEELQPERDLSHTPLFQVMFAFESAAPHDLQFEGLRLQHEETPNETAKFDLFVNVKEQKDGLRCSFNYNTDLFEATTIERMMEHFGNLLAAVIVNPERRISEWRLSSAAESRVLEQWSDGGQVEYSQQSLHELFEAQVTHSGESVALVCGEEKVSYEDLNRRVNQLAHYLRRHGVGPEVLVAICMERSLEMVIAVLGVLKTGGAYVPLDPVYPPERLRFMVEDAAVPVLLTQRHLVAKVPELKARVVALDEEWEQLAEESVANPLLLTTPENLAYVIYTSGSTGQPKGVQIQHRALINFLTAMGERSGFSASDVLLSVTSLSFDIAGLELFLPLITGGRVVVASREEVVDGGLLMARLKSSGATVMQATPATWRLLLEAGWQGDEGLQVLCGGEAMGARLAEELAARSRELWNLYGPTETTIWSSVSKVDGRSAVTIGVPIANTQLYVLDGQGQAVPIGVVGELYIAGDGLARGYLKRPELTAAKFVANPFSRRPGARMYRTGDLVRYRRTGELEFLGRLDQQVKLRGYRIELGEIEAALESHAAVQQAVVTVRKEQLVAYVVGGESALGSVRAVAGELRPYLRERLPEYMVPQHWMVLEQVPLTASGKIDRKSLPAPAAERSFELDQDEETTPMEELVACIWSEVLKLDAVGRDENFFELGGHSLLATQVISRVRKMFGVEVTLRQLFEEPTVRSFSLVIEVQLRRGEGIAVPPLRRLGVEEREQWRGVLPLSFAQERLWFLDQMEPGSTSYNMPLAVRLKGDLNVSALERTLSEIVRRHEVLRTRFVNVSGEPRQEVLEAEAVLLPVTDLRELAEAERETAVREAAIAESREPFDLAHGPMLRVKLLRLGAEEHVVFVTMHHIVSDGWSIGLLIKEVAALYGAYSEGEASPLAELPVQYSDFALWQRGWLQGEELERQLEYWRQRLGGRLPVLELPTDRPRPAVQSYRGARLGLRLPSELSAELKELSRREGTTLFMTLLTAFQILLHRYSGQKEIVVGTDVANRNYRETEGLIGFFVNQLVLRTDMTGEPTFVELLQRVKDVCLGAYAHQDLPFEKLVEELQPERDLNRSPLFQAKLVLQNAPRESLRLGELKLGHVAVEGVTAQFDLMLMMVDGNELSGVLEFNPDLFEERTIARLGKQFAELLQSIVTEPNGRIGMLELETKAEREQVLSGWNPPVVVANEETCSLVQLFEVQVEQRLEAVAIVSDGDQLSYEELNRRANQLGHYLRAQGVGPEVVVGVCLERSVEMVVGLLGILKAGGAYLPLDPTYPRQRLEYMLSDAQVGLVLTQGRLVEQLPVHWGRTIAIDDEWTTIADESAENPESITTAENLAYVMYTSGSTGQPKGVMITQGGLVNYLQYATATYPFAAGSGTPLHSTLSFDLTVTSLYGPLLVGGWTELMNEGEGRSGLEEAWRERSGYSVVKLTPAHLRLLNGEESPERLREWSKGVIVGGEALSWEQVRPWIAAGVRVYNEYGPTETVVGSCVYELQADAEERGGNGGVPIGRPIYNTEMYVLDQWQRPVAVGVRGEIYIGGAGVARGYLLRAELTAERFVPHPYSAVGGERLYRTGDEGRYLEDGTIEYLGRRDQQVKLRGYRIELGEIEAVLERHHGVRQAVMLVREEQLVGYVVAAAGARWSGSEREAGAELRNYLRERMPEYMVPQRWVVLDQMPLTRNGKVDREGLPAPSAARVIDWEEAEATPVEELVAGIWSEVLKLEAVGRDENFFELGGHSLLATQVVSRVREVLGVEVELRSLFEAPTVRGLSRSIEEELRAGEGLVVPPLQREAAKRERWGGLLPLSFAQQRLWFLDQLAPESASYIIPAAVRLKGELNVEALERTLSDIVRRHEVLRTRFVSVGGEPRQQVLEAEPVSLLVTDLSGLEETEREAAVQEAVTLDSHDLFDLANGPLLRVKLLRLGTEEHVVLLTMHHIVSDGWSMGLLIKEVATLYEAYSRGEESPLTALPVQYGDFTMWQQGWLQGEELEEQLRYWRRQLGGELPVLELPTDRPRPESQSYRGSQRIFKLNDEVADAVKALSRREGVTLFMTLLAAFQTLLYRYTQIPDILIGTAIAGRTHKQTEPLLGCFVNTLVLRTDLSGNPPFSNLLRRVREVTLNAYAHQAVPFEKLVEELQPERRLSHTPLFQVAFGVQNTPQITLDLPGLQLSRIAAPNEMGRFELTVWVVETADGMRVRWSYNTDLFDESRIERMQSHYETLLRSIVADPETALNSLDMLTPAEKDELLIKDKESEDSAHKRFASAKLKPISLKTSA